ncbi:MAG: hypothetical protein J6J74_00420 [Elusimicrobiaceae bacterium]|nr:hypothetical protein [Elusimicrobiaceae bacterium]
MHKSIKFLGIFLIFSSPLFAGKIQIYNPLLNQHHNFTFFNIPLTCTKTKTSLSCASCCKKEPDCDIILAPNRKKLSYNTKQKNYTETPLERALAKQQHLDLLPEEKALPDVSSVIYQCPNSDIVLFEQRYGKEAYLLYQFRKNSTFEWTDYCGESSFKNTPHLFDYICGLSDDDILNARGFPSFPEADLPNETPRQNSTSAEQTETDQKISKKTSSTQKGQQAAVMPIQSHSNAWNVLGDYFYPADVPGNLSNMRRFETKNKSKEIKINFSSKNKQPFLEKLKTAHRYHPTRQTECAGGGTLYETISDEIYQAYLLSENTITVFSAAYSLPTLPEEPHASRMQKELCTLDVNSKW